MLVELLGRHARHVDPGSSGATAASMYTDDGANGGTDGSGAVRGHFPLVRRQTPPATRGATHYATAVRTATPAVAQSDHRLNWVTIVTVHPRLPTPRSTASPGDVTPGY